MSAIEQAINELLRAEWGEGQRAVALTPLSDRMAVVQRVQTAGAPAPASVIVKHLQPEQFPLPAGGSANLEFLEELATHRFLRGQGIEHGLKPRLLASDPRGLFLLEDLGPANYERERTFEELVPMLALALARLHAGTAGHRDEYLEQRAQLGLPAPDEDARRYGEREHRRRFRLGAEHLLTRTANAEKSALAAELESVATLIEEPGAWACLLHDDLANARQTFETPAGLLLVDFEDAKWGHALLDLVKPTIGKIEVDLDSGVHVWTCPGFGLTLADEYRLQFQTLTGRAIPREEWHRHLVAALVYGAVALAGRVLAYAPEVVLSGTRQQNVNGILYRLHGLLERLPAGPALRRLGEPRLVTTPF